MTFASDLVDLSDYAFGRLTDRLDGLTDDEFWWKPAPNAWSIHQEADGTYAPDGARGPDGTTIPDPPPVTTIAWRLWHIADLLDDHRTATWLGLTADYPRQSVPGSADDALAALAVAGAGWHTRLNALDDSALLTPIGPVAAHYGDSSRNSFALHIIDELIHHAAEVALLRDLYLAHRS